MSLVKYHPHRSTKNYSPFFPSFFDDFFTKGESTDNFSPRVDISETEEGYSLSLALAGFKKEDVSIEVKDGRLFISGERKFEENKEGYKFHRVETRFGKFSKTFKVPENVDGEKITASFEDGLLNVVLPKDAKKAKSNTIKIS